VIPDPNAAFRDPARVRAVADRVRRLADRLDRPVRFMEVCGTHTMSAARNGLRALLPANVRLTSGPGCPVCVTGPGYVVAACDIARRGAVIATFGDMIRVPGGDRSLEAERAAGAEIRVVYSPLDALAIARRAPTRDVVLLGVGFETTAPTVAAAILEAERGGLKNFSVLAAHKTMPNAMRAIASSPDIALDGFLCPGHVSTVTGSGIYRFLADEFGLPCAISGFEPVDILEGVASLLEQRIEGRPRVEIVYRRAVRPAGNAVARAAMAEVFEPFDADWRGIGVIPGSGLAIRAARAAVAARGGFDAERRFSITVPAVAPPRGCRCGEILRGAAEPVECPLFGRACAPDRPVGPCMVSSEGACAAAYLYPGASPLGSVPDTWDTFSHSIRENDTPAKSVPSVRD
jgi:hydrogenase expression/formation protein HypD